MSAGEHLSDDMLSAWRARFGMDIFEAVGMSEFRITCHRAFTGQSAPAPRVFHSRDITSSYSIRKRCCR